jgi:hypothetical protein
VNNGGCALVAAAAVVVEKSWRQESFAAVQMQMQIQIGDEV